MAGLVSPGAGALAAAQPGDRGVWRAQFARRSRPAASPGDGGPSQRGRVRRGRRARAVAPPARRCLPGASVAPAVGRRRCLRLRDALLPQQPAARRLDTDSRGIARLVRHLADVSLAVENREKPPMKRHLLTAGLALLFLVPLAAQQRAPQNESITQADLRADLFFLAGDAMRGRLTDTEENRATADYIRSRFERMGFKPVGPNGSFFQPYNLMTAALGEGNRLDVIAGEGATRHLVVGQEFYPQRISASGQVSAPLTFVGFGISAPHLQHDDYNGDVNGKIVVALGQDIGRRPSRI